jgi:hypothetical protein
MSVKARKRGYLLRQRLISSVILEGSINLIEKGTDCDSFRKGQIFTADNLT